jgi:putative SOS response-associated peptidase YedK
VRSKRRGRKQPYFIRGKDDPLLAFAGIWEPDPLDDTADASGEPGPRVDSTCAVLTRPAADPIAWLHDRMPLMLSREDLGLWLDPDADAGALDDLIHARRADAAPSLTTRPVSARVNRPANEDPSLLDHIDPASSETAGTSDPSGAQRKGKGRSGSPTGPSSVSESQGNLFDDA